MLKFWDVDNICDTFFNELQPNEHILTVGNSSDSPDDNDDF